MPCSDGGSRFGESVRIEYRDNPKFKKEIDALTQLLCFTIGELVSLTDNGPLDTSVMEDIFERNEPLAVWWLQHTASDKERLTNEMYSFIRQHPTESRKDIVNAFIKNAERVHAVSQWHKGEFFGNCYDAALQQFEKDTPALQRVKQKLTKEEYEAIVKSIK